MATKTKAPKGKAKEKKQNKAVAKKTAKAPKAVKPLKVAKTAKKTVEAPVPAPGIEKKEIIEQYQVKAGDTGSPEVQIALLTKRIDKLMGHLKANPADNHSRRGLLGIVSKRRRLLNYLEKRDEKRFKGIAGKLGIGK